MYKLLWAFVGVVLISPFEWHGPNPCWLSLTIIVDWRVVDRDRYLACLVAVLQSHISVLFHLIASDWYIFKWTRSREDDKDIGSIRHGLVWCTCNRPRLHHGGNWHIEENVSAKGLRTATVLLHAFGRLSQEFGHLASRELISNGKYWQWHVCA